jgi:hypothetical protein
VEVIMLHGIRQVEGFSVRASDGPAGVVSDIYLDRACKRISHMVVASGRWPERSRVAAVIESLALIDWIERSVQLGLSREQIAACPEASRLLGAGQIGAYDYFDDPYYWTGSLLWGTPTFAGLADSDIRDAHERAAQQRGAQNDAQALACSVKDMVGCSLHAADGSLGHISDFLFDDEDWSVQWMVADPRNWWPGPHVLIPLDRLEGFDALAREMAVDMRREEVRASPPYDAMHLPPALHARPPARPGADYSPG